MKELMIYRTWIQNRLLQIDTSDEYDSDGPLEISLKLHWYRWGVEIELMAIKYSICIYVGYQHLHFMETDKDGNIMYEMKRQ